MQFLVKILIFKFFYFQKVFSLWKFWMFGKNFANILKNQESWKIRGFGGPQMCPIFQNSMRKHCQITTFRNFSSVWKILLNLRSKHKRWYRHSTWSLKIFRQSKYFKKPCRITFAGLGYKAIKILIFRKILDFHKKISIKFHF